MSAADFHLLRQYLCRFFQDTRIKVSLFLQSGIQGMDGTLAIRHDGFTASGGRVPGVVRYFDDEGNPDEEEKFLIASAEGTVEAPKVHILEREQINSHLGFNMYEADSKSGGKLARSTKDTIADAKRGGASGFENRKHQKLFKATAADGLNLLADLLGSSVKEVEGESKAFKINLFPDELTRSKGVGGEDDGEDGKAVPTIWIDASSDHKSSTESILEELKLDEDAKHESKGALDDDLLELMDSTTS